MPTRTYKLWWNSLTTGDNKASLRIAKKGVITSIRYVNQILTNAGGFALQIELSKQSSNSILMNDTPPTVISENVFAYASSTSYANQDCSQIGMQNPVDPLDTLYVHQIFAGSVPTSGNLTIVLTVLEAA